MYDAIILSAFPLLVAAAGISDYFTFRIPNWINALIAVSIIPFAVFSAMPPDIFAWHVVAGLIAFVLGFGLFALNLIGGGDAKMIAACGLWIGWDALLEFGFATVLAGGVLALVIKLWSLFGSRSNVAAVGWAKNYFSKKPKLPYGIAIAAGGIMVFPATWWFQQITQYT